MAVFKAQRSPGIFLWVRIHDQTTKQGYWIPDGDRPNRPSSTRQEVGIGYLRGLIISWKLKAQRWKLRARAARLCWISITLG